MLTRPGALLVLLGALGDAAATPPGRLIGLGVALDAGTSAPLATGPEGSSAPPVRLRLSWDAIVTADGVYDWSGADRTVAELGGLDRPLVVELAASPVVHRVEGALPSPLEPDAHAAWLVFVRAAVRRYGERAMAFQIGSRLEPVDAWRTNTVALALKQSALAVRSEALSRGLEPLVVLPAVPAAATELVSALWAADLAAYADVWPVLIDPTAPSEQGLGGLERVLAESVLHPPATRVWAYVEPADDWSAAALAVEALSHGAELAFVSLEPGSPARLFDWIAGLDAQLADGMAPAPAGNARVESRAAGEAAGRVLGRFFGDRDFTTLVVYATDRPADAEPAPVLLIVDAVAVRNPRALDLVTGERRFVRAVDHAPGERALEVAGTVVPGGLTFDIGQTLPGLDLPPEEVEIASTRALTAEEIIARYQEVQREQDQRFERLLARGRVDIHFRLSQGGSTIDVGIDSQYFLERGGELEWEQLDYYVNGSRVPWKDFPRLPLIQPEKVVTLPLDLTLDETYRYRLRGEERVGGREAWIVEFEPAADDAREALYRGRLWIDRERFVRLRAALVQGNLESPVISNEEVDRYTEHLGPDGRSFWLLTEVEGQQVWNVAGRSFVVQRELRFSDFRINLPEDEFTRRRTEAYASRNTMLRDTAAGFRYLLPADDGGREVTERVATSQVFAGGGVFQDASRDEVVPLAAVNYFNYDLFGRNIQTNVLFAGVLAVINVSKPDLAGGRFDLTLDSVLTALPGDDKIFSLGVEQEVERLELLRERLALRAGLPLGEFFKLNFIAGLDYLDYETSDESDRAIAAYEAAHPPAMLGYVVPQDHGLASATLEATFNRRGWSLAAEASRAQRSAWEAWGLRDEASGQLGSIDPVSGLFVATGGEPVLEAFTLYRATAFKNWLLPAFQQLRGEATWLDGDDLDRFSRYQFSYFGADRLNGFSGSGLRFDRGGLARAGYSFNLLGALRFDLGLDWARVEDLSMRDGFQSFSGVGVNANFPVPWKTVVSLSYGRAVSSDIQELEGEDEFLLLILKLF